MAQQVLPQRKINAAKDFIAIMFAEGTVIAGLGAASLKETFASVMRDSSTLSVVSNAMAVGVDAVLIGGGAVMVYKAYGYLKELRRFTRNDNQFQARA